MRQVYVGVIALGLLASENVEAAPQDQIGAGAASCSDLVALAPNSPDRGQYAQWSLGYMAGLTGRTTHQLPLEINLSSVGQYLQEFCTNNPTQTIFYATSAIAAQHKVGL